MNGLDRGRFCPSLFLLRDEVRYPLAEDVAVTALDHHRSIDTPRTIRRLRQAIEEAAPDVVLSAVDYASQFAGQAIQGCRRQPRWVARLGTNPQHTYSGWRGTLGRLWQDFVYRHADWFVANSAGLAESFRLARPAFADRVSTIGNPVDLHRIVQDAQMDPPHGPGTRPVIVSVGRLHRLKRYDVMLAAFQRVLAALDAELWLIGDGPERGTVERMIGQLGLADRVRLLGFQPNPHRLTRQASVFVMTSDSEGLPNALQEAQALGIPAVAVDCPFGPGEIIAHQQTGLLVEPGDPTQVADALLQILQDKQLHQRMSEAAPRRIQQLYATNVILQQWESLFARLAANSAA